jgi:predicted hydrocarbon binding protein
MNRKQFLHGTLQWGLAAETAALFPFTGGKPQMAQEDQRSKELRFRDAWVATLMQVMEKDLDEPVRSGLMESCGRSCARRSPMMKTAQSCKGDVGKLVKALAGILGEGSTMTGNIIQLRYPKCYCELVADGPDRLPDVYCHCSEGWVKEMFETAAQKEVQVETIQTIKRGADSCKFRITI